VIYYKFIYICHSLPLLYSFFFQLCIVFYESLLSLSAVNLPNKLLCHLPTYLLEYLGLT
jgi:hypothetical protein